MHDNEAKVKNMSRDQAKIVLLESALMRSRNTIEFMHGCLTETAHYSYDYPQNTTKLLKEINALVPEKSAACYHSVRKENCESCKTTVARWDLEGRARAVLGKRETA